MALADYGPSDSRMNAALVKPSPEQMTAQMSDMMGRFSPHTPYATPSGGSGSRSVNVTSDNVSAVPSHPTPQRKPPIPGSPEDQVPFGGYKRGGKAKGYAGGGIPTSEALSPWYARAEERGMVHPEGLINATGGGRTDVHNINVPSGAYVVPADVVSGLGEGNTLSGSAVIDRMMHSNPYGIQGSGGKRGAMGPPRPPAPFREPSQQFESRGGAAKDHGGHVPIVIAGGEYLIHPDTIIKKFGNLQKGHAALDKWVVNTRKDTAKTMLKLPGPKGASKK